MKKYMIIVIVLLALIAGFLLYFKTFGYRSTADQITSFPFKFDEKDRWGMMDFDGNILVEDEWKEMPSVGINGIVRVENKDNKYEFYTTEKKPKKIGGEYISAGLFFDGLAPVSEENKPISFIDKNGKEVFLLKEINGKLVEVAGNFHEGLALVKTAENKWGYINTKGVAVIAPKFDNANNFHDGMALVEVEDKDSVGKMRQGIIDKNGNWLIKPQDKNRLLYYSENTIVYSEDGDEGKPICGFLNKNGEKLIKANKKFNNLSAMHEGYCTYTDGEDEGILNSKGEIVIRAKYEYAYYSNGAIVIGDKKKYGIMDIKGNYIKKDEYDDILPFFKKNTIVKDGNDYLLINKKGEQVGKDFDECAMVYFYFAMDDFTVTESDYFDPNVATNKLITSLNDYSLNGLTKNTSLSDIMIKHNLTRLDLSYSNNVEVSSVALVKDINYNALYLFDKDVQHQTYETQTYYGYSFSIPKGYEVSYDAKLFGIVYQLNLKENRKNKISSFVDQLGNKIVKTIPLKEKYTDNIFTFSSNDKKTVVLGFSKNTIYLVYSFDMNIESLLNNLKSRIEEELTASNKSVDNDYPTETESTE